MPSSTPKKAPATKAVTKSAPVKRVAAKKTPPPAQISLPASIHLPKWNDAGSVTAFLLTVASFVFGVLTTAHITVPQHTSDSISTLAGVLGVVIAAVVQGINVIRVSTVQKSAIAAGVPVVSKPKKVRKPKS